MVTEANLNEESNAAESDAFEWINLRPARDEDLEYLNSYAYTEGMDNVPGIQNVTVAASKEGDIPVGFIRIAMGANGVAHVNPVVVCSNWRGYGIGRILVDYAQETFGELRLVSRGSSLAFYQALGFKDVSWDDIDMAVTDDCVACGMREECRPQPMARA